MSQVLLQFAIQTLYPYLSLYHYLIMKFKNNFIGKTKFTPKPLKLSLFLLVERLRAE